MSTELNRIIEPAVVALGYELVGCELVSQPGGSLLRVYIDREHGGVGVDDCVAISRQVSAVLDVEDPLPGAYHLEVSSPGIDRPLFKLAHYQQYIGSYARIRLKVPIEGCRNLKAQIVAVMDGCIHLKMDQDKTVIVEFPEIDKANLVKQ